MVMVMYFLKQNQIHIIFFILKMNINLFWNWLKNHFNSIFCETYFVIKIIFKNQNLKTQPFSTGPKVSHGPIWTLGFSYHV